MEFMQISLLAIFRMQDLDFVFIVASSLNGQLVSGDIPFRFTCQGSRLFGLHSAAVSGRR